MIVSTIIDINIKAVNKFGAGVSVAALCGEVINDLGKVVDTITLNELTELTHGVYQLRNYRIDDVSKFPGSTFSIFWSVCEDNVSPSEVFQYYNIQSDHATGYKHRMFTWAPSGNKSLSGYLIQRKKPGEDAYTDIGLASYPYWFDREVYDSISEARASVFQVMEQLWLVGKPEGPQGGQIMPNVCLTELQSDVCQLGGSVLDVVGRNAKVDSIYFFVHHKDAPMLLGANLYVKDNEYAVPVNPQGFFSAPLVQGLLMTIHIPAAGLAAKFVVPSQAHACLSDLELMPIELHRAQ